MKYLSYPTYKPSNIDWIGNIPTDWEVKKLKFISKINTGSKNTVDYEDDGEYPFFVRSDNVERISTYSFNGEAILTAGDGVGVGKVFHYYNGKFDYHQRVYKISSFPNYVFGKFVYRFFSNNFENEILKYNAKSTVDSIRYWMLSGFPIVIPPLQTQQTISTYLDTQTSKIDELVSKDETLIDLLQQKRVSLINEVVTKGLDKNIEMKDSGIEWIGKIPTDWEVRKLKFVVNVNPSTKKYKKPNTLVSFLPMEKVGEDGIYDSESCCMFEEVSLGYTKFLENDVILAKITPCFENGKGCLLGKMINNIGFGSTEFIVLRSNYEYNPQLLYYFTKTHIFRIVGEKFMQGSAGQKRIPTDFVKNFPLPLPPLSQQQKLVDFLDKETQKIDITISKIQKRIELYKERKQSLIHNVVTGKIMV